MASAAAIGATLPALAQTKLKGRIRQSVCRWCYESGKNKIPMEEFAKAVSEMGLVGIDLVAPKDWPVLKKYGLISTMNYGCGDLREGVNHTESHDKVEKQFMETAPLVVKEGWKNMITFSGNRRGISEDEGIANCVAFFRRVVPTAEKLGVTLHFEYLNSKVDHKDYQFDHMNFGVEVARQINSPNFKILFDIYHVQIMEGDIIRFIKNHHQWIGHYHTGGNPGRHEIDDTQELNYAAIARAIVETGFTGFVAHEFVPTRDPLQSLREAVKLCDI
jgi:hydroxypyruvate isomerase